jgi:hypothetical protein
LKFDVWARPLWSWACELMTDLHIVSQFHWDAERHYKHNESHQERFERIIDEPWTADEWWKFQV